MPGPHTEQLIRKLHNAFDYTADNNRDLIGDATFPFHSIIEEVVAKAAYEYLVAYLTNPTNEHIELQLQDRLED